ncbi:MAG: ATP-binding protein, partial [Candidatus Pacebacteria bacterium]|nr:ATP-binding protein [Candidatus Paceibacterota bacterium]
KWAGVMKHEDLPEIKDTYKRDVTLRLLENQEQFLAEAAPTNSTGDNIKNWDPIMISLVRRSMPNLMAYDICGVQPMTGPTGLIFAMKSKYDTQGSADEALFGEADTGHSGTGTHQGITGTVNPFTDPAPTSGAGMTTAAAEGLGAGTFKEMAFSIDKTMVSAKSRALKAEYSTELAQDLKAVHGLDAETELSNSLSTEILQEINREVVRRIYTNARWGAESTAHGTTANGVFDLDTDSNGRWSVEKFKGLMFQIERDRNSIAFDTRRGKGNFMICSADVASALSMSGMLETGHGTGGDFSSSTYVGTMNGMKVYVDPYYGTTAGQFYVVGYKGSSPYDAGMFYCPYVPLQMVRAMGENTFQPKIGFKTRYGMVSNPFTAITSGANSYYRKVVVANLM